MPADILTFGHLLPRISFHYPVTEAEKAFGAAARPVLARSLSFVRFLFALDLKSEF
jgi:hypothetical protein